MVRFENQCVDCPPERGCLGSACPNRNVPICECDNCRDEMDADDLYDYDGEMLCGPCVLMRYETVAQVGIDKFV